MGYLLKEALKTLCGVNQWAYAVLWKIGYQNPKLLIREECYFDPTSFALLSGVPVNENAFQGFNYESTDQVGDKVQLLVNKMMTDSQVNIVGEGLIGRVAFTGSHQWILSDIYQGKVYPPEVLEELYLQFSAGIKTIAVIPVLPHGVIQFGSHLTIKENMGFVNDVAILLHQLGEVPGALLSDCYTSKEASPRLDFSACHESNVMDDSSLITGSLSHVGSSAYNSVFNNQASFPLITETPNDLPSAVAFQSLNSCSRRLKYNQKADFSTAVKFDLPQANQLMNVGVKAEVISPHSPMWSTLSFPSRGSQSLSRSPMRCIPQSGKGNQPPARSPNSTSFDRMPCQGSDPSLKSRAFQSGRVNISATSSVDRLTGNISHAFCSADQLQDLDKRIAQSEDYTAHDLDSSASRIAWDHSPFSRIPNFLEDGTKLKFGDLGQARKITGHDDSFAEQQCGDDLFDIFGADFKNKLLSNCWSGCFDNNSSINDHSEAYDFPSGKKLSTSEPVAANQEYQASEIFSMDTDHLLDAVVSNVQSTATQSWEDSVSCRTNISSSSGPNVSLPYRQYEASDNTKGKKLFNIPKYLSNPGVGSSCSLKSTLSKEDSGSYSPSTSVYEPQSSTWIEKGTQNRKLSNSASTECSKKLNEPSKITRKRLKPGENPRPRPKDRQMIQDRVKELREIVPNGAKCSIDALLERTIKHMLFLQSVTKHADKLKETEQSKVISNDDNLLSKDKFEGGATWAYEVGSHSMVCPIIVEDLNQPRQFLVEMLCEERGTFLEIADIIRGLGLGILKGVMETRHDKIRSRFVVEANRDVTRMEIFLSLVHLLERNSKPCDSQVPDASHDKRTVQQLH